MPIDPAMIDDLSGKLDARKTRAVPDYLMRDKLYPDEDTFFKANPHVAGMAAEDNKITMNPYSPLKPQEKEAVKVNELTRLYLRNSKTPLEFGLTDQQRKAFKDYSKDENDIRATIIGRIVSGDSSAGSVTPEQTEAANQVRSALFNSKYGLRQNATPKGEGWLGALPIKYPDGKEGVATEYSVGISFDGENYELPALVPTLTPEEVNIMVNDIMPNHKQVPEPILKKAVEHAKGRLEQGLSPYKD
jgi:hypothetical protein